MSLKAIRFISVFLLVGLSVGCSVTKHQNFNPAVIENDSSIKLMSSLENEEIALEFVPSTGGAAASAQFGLIGAIVGSAVDAGINNSRAKSAEEKVEPFRVALSDVDVREMLRDNLSASPLASPWPTTVDITSDNPPKSGVSANFLNTFDERYFILVSTTYQLKPSLQVLELKTSYSVWDKNILSKKKSTKKKAAQTNTRVKTIKPLYSHNVIYQSFPHNPNKRFLTEEERNSELAAYTLKYPVGSNVSAKKRTSNQKKVDKFSQSLKTKTKVDERYSADGKVWLDNDGEKLKEALIDGIREVSRIVVADLSGQLSLPETAFEKTNKTPTYVLETKDDGRILERAVTGGIVSRNKDYPLYTAFD